MKKNIEALWMGKPIPPKASPEEDRLVGEKMAEMRTAYSKLEAQMNPESKRTFDEYVKLQSEINTLEQRSAFVYGFSLGVKLICEGLED